MKGLVISFISKAAQLSEYDWANILFDDVCVGKARCLIEDNKFTIFSINVYPEFQGKGYGKAFVDSIILRYDTVIADKVRFTAIKFWESEGFIKDGESGNWIYHKVLPII